MAKKARIASVLSLKPHLARSLKEAKALRGKVAKSADLESLIGHLEALQSSAATNCSGTSWGRKFELAAAPPAKTARKSAKKR
jgi:hypothetical protein